MLSPRTLKNWRRDALLIKEEARKHEKEDEWWSANHQKFEMAVRIIRLTQELTDEYLIRE